MLKCCHWLQVESERIATELQRKKDQEKEVEEERQRERVC